ncbi:MAG: hypothetical protein J7K69_01605 [Thermotogae bacterium]|nr:hypothetical protein [Thermotogota bacterium]
MIVGELKKGKYRDYLRGEDLFVHIAVRGEEERYVIAYSPELMNRNIFHIVLYMKRMQCEQMHREIKKRLNF